MICAGELNKKVVLQSYTTSQDSYGAEVKTYSDTATVWAKTTPLKGREYFQAKQINAEIELEIKIRYRSVNPKMRIKFGARYFEILSVINVDEKNEELLLMCKEVV